MGTTNALNGTIFRASTFTYTLVSQVSFFSGVRIWQFNPNTG